MIRRLLAHVDALSVMRRDTERQLADFNGGNPSCRPSSTLPVRNRRRWTNGLLESRSRLVSLRRALSGKQAIVVAASSRRLPLRGALRDEMSSLLTALPGREGCPQEYVDDLRAAVLILCDPTELSSLRSSTADESEVVLDERLLLHALIWSPLMAVQAAARAVALIALADGTKAAVRELVAAAAYATVFDHLFKPCAQLRGLLLTSNSFSIEMLRFHLLDAPASAGVLEVLHGVPTVAFTKYLETVYESGQGDIAKPAFIAQVPDLELPDPLLSLMDRERAINTYFNQRLAGWTDDQAVLEDRVRLMLGGIPDKSTTIVAVIGGTSFDADYRDSAAFRMECQLIDIISDTFTAHGRRCVFVYSPHPANAAVSFAECPELKRDSVRIHTDSILSWLAADLCVGLYSSGLFEANYLGVSVFAPLKATDDIFDIRLLRMLSVAHDDVSGLAAARKWAAGEVTHLRDEPLMTRASLRLGLLRQTGPGVALVVPT